MRWLGRRLRGVVLALLLGVLVVVAIDAARSAAPLASGGRSGDDPGPPFAHVDGAAWALVAALQHDDGALRALLGDGVTLDRSSLAAASHELVQLEDFGERCVMLRLGLVGSTVPVPLVREHAGWRFASTATHPSCGVARNR